jgi:hypothetical protein
VADQSVHGDVQCERRDGRYDEAAGLRDKFDCAAGDADGLYIHGLVAERTIHDACREHDIYGAVED